MHRLKQYDTFTLAQDLSPVIRSGSTGVILEVWSDWSIEVEFVLPDGTNIEYDGQSTFTMDASFIMPISSSPD